MAESRINRKYFFLNIILPTFLTIGLFIVLIFRFIIPYFEQNMLNGKKEMLRELVQASISVVSEHEREAVAGKITVEEAREKALAAIRFIRYGIGNKDYFWITDRHPRMIMHPYRPDLDGRDLSDFQDPQGKRLFVDMARVVEESGEGYVDYIWQWMDDASRLVPKISYVKEFKPWGWIIGTGIYIEDVRRELAAIKGRLVLVSLVISALMALLLTFIARNNLIVERRRSRAEHDLKESREKYKALVEASTEGTWMILEGKTIYANLKAREYFPASVGETIPADFPEIFAAADSPELVRIKDFLAGTDPFLQLETRLLCGGRKGMDAILSISKIVLSEKKGLIIMIKELGRRQRESGGEERDWIERFADLVGGGYFRASMGKKGRIDDIDERTRGILGYDTVDDVLNLSLPELIADRKEWKGLLIRLEREGRVSEYPIHIRSRDRKIRILAVTGRLIRNDQGAAAYTEGFLRDITEKKRRETIQAEVLAEIQNSVLFMSRPVIELASDPVFCDWKTSIKDAAVLMSSHEKSSLVITLPEGETLGILTDHDMRRRAVSAGIDLEKPVFEIMSSPIVSVAEHLPLCEALSRMQSKGIGHLAVSKTGRGIVGVLSRREIIATPHGIEEFFLERIRTAATFEEIDSLFPRLPLFVEALVSGGARSAVINRLISSVADAITCKLIDSVHKELGPAPVPYAFVALGSEGRSEQTLLTDQDNALIFANLEEGREQTIRGYFIRFAERLNPLLDQAGFLLCTGEVMARNPRWNQELQVWKEYFSEWITRPEPQNILEISTFFDMRMISGDSRIVDELKDHVERKLKTNPAFLNHLARVCMNYKIPLGIFGRIQTESADGHEESINIKNAVRVIVNLVRLYAMSQGIRETVTWRRLQRLYEEGIFTSSLYRDILHAFDFLQTLQFRSQTAAFRLGRQLDHYVDLADLSGIEVDTLKSALTRISYFQSRLKHDFSVPE